MYACREGFSFARWGLAACGIDTATTGTHAVEFWVVDSVTRRRVSVTRTIRVVAPCATGEERCADGSCSAAGTCRAAPLAGELAATRKPPRIALLPLPGHGSAVDIAVPYGWQYKACTAGSLQLLDEPCEPGACSFGFYQILLCSLRLCAQVPQAS